jgi:tRNA(Ile)-lysidine synthase TilS/MesJ
MALAVLFSELHKTFPTFRIADHEFKRVYAVVIDHGIRQGSSEEASEVVKHVRSLGIYARVQPISWPKELREKVTSGELPNLESVARTLRYRSLGLSCAHSHATSLFLGHHQDDQYETLLMRLLSGHGYRGLGGVSAASDIPECHDLYDVSKSGLLADLELKHPFLRFQPSNKEIRLLRREFKQASDSKRIALRKWPSLDGIHFQSHVPQMVDHTVPYLTPLNSEDGGVMIYRPLLEFGKDRLIATCEANKVTWFDDHTNSDRTLTTRNAIRYMVANHELPVALQKPSILALSTAARRRMKSEEAEAKSLIRREAVIREFDPSAGTLLVEMPTFQRPARRGRRYHEAREEARRPRRATVAALAVRNLISFVTPDEHLPTLASLEGVVQRLFPELNPTQSLPPPTAFSISGVLFSPVNRPGSNRWFLSRAPYESRKPMPQKGWIFHSSPEEERHGKEGEDDGSFKVEASWRRQKRAWLWDGRYWITMHTKVRDAFRIMPFSPEHAKTFRSALGPKERARLEAILKHYAPGKVRYTLPAIYHTSESKLAMLSPPLAGSSDGAGGGSAGSQTLLALPSIRVHLPGLERWLKYDITYKRVDLTLLRQRKRGTRKPVLRYNAAYSKSRRRRRTREEASVRASRRMHPYHVTSIPVH